MDIVESLFVLTLMLTVAFVIPILILWIASFWTDGDPFGFRNDDYN